ncbi:MAG: hypothetical protein RPS47_04545 [Colwellia sp.]
MAITSKEVIHNPESFDDSLFWITQSPTYDDINNKITPWDWLGEIYDLKSTINIHDFQNKIMEIESTIFPFMKLSPGKSLSNNMVSCMPIRDRHIAPFPRESDSNTLNIVRVERATDPKCFDFDVISSMSISKITLINTMRRTKVVKMAKGHRYGIYLIKFIRAHALLHNQIGKEVWVTVDQLKSIRKICTVEILSSVMFIQCIDDLKRVSIKSHPSFKNLIPKPKQYQSIQHQEYFEKIILLFALNIPHNTHLHPYSMFVQGQAWVKSLEKALEFYDEGYKITSFNYRHIRCES